MKNIKLLISITSTIFAFGSSAVLTFFLTPILINSIGFEAFSFYPLTNNFINFISLIIVSISTTSTRHIKNSMSKGSRSETIELFSTSFFLNSFFSIIILIIFIPISFNLERIINIPVTLTKDVIFLFVMTILSITIRFYSTSFGTVIYLNEDLYLRALSELVMNFVKIVSLGILFLNFNPSIVFIGISNILMSITLFSFNFIYYLKYSYLYPLKTKYFNFIYVKKIVFSGFWNSINQLGMLIIYTSAITIANITLGVEFSSYIPLFLFFPLFVQSLSSITTSVFFPRMIRQFNTKNEFIISKDLNFLFLTNILITIPLLVSFIYFSRSFYGLWTPNVNVELLLIHSNFTSIYTIIIVFFLPLTYIIIVEDKQKIPGIVSIIFGILNIIITYILMRFTNFGLYSSTVLLLVLTSIYFGIFLPFYSLIDHKNLVKKIYFKFISNLIAIFLSFEVITFLNLNKSISSWIDFLLNFILVCFVTLTFLVVSYLFEINIKKIKKLFSRYLI